LMLLRCLARDLDALSYLPRATVWGQISQALLSLAFLGFPHTNLAEIQVCGEPPRAENLLMPLLATHPFKRAVKHYRSPGQPHMYFGLEQKLVCRLQHYLRSACMPGYTLVKKKR
jgi:hypothetical protein